MAHWSLRWSLLYRDVDFYERLLTDGRGKEYTADMLDSQLTELKPSCGRFQKLAVWSMQHLSNKSHLLQRHWNEIVEE
jgi:hypothetical protein